MREEVIQVEAMTARDMRQIAQGLGYPSTLEALEHLGAICEALQDSAALEIVDSCGWSLSLCFGKGDKARDRMRAASDILRSLKNGRA